MAFHPDPKSDSLQGNQSQRSSAGRDSKESGDLLSDPSGLIQERQATHGDAWRLTGRLLHWLPEHEQTFLKIVLPDALFPWIMILNKCMRILYSPLEVDHWRDIAGYATLVVDFLESAPHKE